MRPVRVLIVDDSSVVRWLVSSALAAQPQIEVVGVASNGRAALELVGPRRPDVITLDVHMPVMDGLETLERLRREHPDLPVIMFSSVTQRGAATTVEALLRGASDYLTKPERTLGVDKAVEAMSAALVPKILALGRRRPDRSDTRARPTGRPATTPAHAAQIIVVGVSTGGPNALIQIVPALPADLGIPVVIVQHMPLMFTRLLRDRLAEVCALEVEEAYEGARLEGGKVWIAPGSVHTSVSLSDQGPCLHVHDGPEENFCRPSADVLFRSAAGAFGSAVLAVILTGMGRDGLRGCEAIFQAGGDVIAQDELTSVVWGMPGAVVNAGLARLVLPLGEIAGAVARRAAIADPPKAERGGRR